jgi:hypothetical protein
MVGTGIMPTGHICSASQVHLLFVSAEPIGHKAEIDVIKRSKVSSPYSQLNAIPSL